MQLPKLRALTRREWLLVAASATGMGLLAVLMMFVYLSFTVPTIRSLGDYAPKQTTHIYSDDGELVGQLYAERRTVVPFGSIPEHVVRAFLSAEDAGFYEHSGLDYLGILRAAVKNLRPGANLQGASTITQQTVKTLVLGPERSYWRKMREAILARRLEQLLSKDDILHIYLNQIYFGSGAYGVEEASKTYFGKSVRELTLGEATLLASVPKNPARYAPTGDADAVRQRQAYVLDQMAGLGWITPDERASAAAAELPDAASVPPYLGGAPHYVEHVRRVLIDKLGEQSTYEGGLTVYTGMNAPAQAAAHDAVRSGLEELTRRQGFPGARLRVEVDRLARYRDALHAAFTEKQQQLSHTKAAAGVATWMWDLSRVSTTSLNEAESARNVMMLKPLSIGARTTGLVVQIDSVADEVWIDLGGAQGQIPWPSLEWARRFSPTTWTPPPRDSADIFHPGDLVAVEIISIDLPPDEPTTQPRITLDLVPVPRAEAALVAIDPHTRYVRALVGGYDLDPSGFNRATQALRQPGSAFKPIVYAAAIKAGALTPATLCADTPIVIRDPWTGKAWKPENYEDGRYDGNITYRTALKRSKNTCSVKLIEKLGPDAVMEMARAMGISATLPRNLTLALGSGDVTPIDLANAYATIDAGGFAMPPVFIRKVVDPGGTVLLEETTEPSEAMPAATAFVLADMMRSVVDDGTGVRARVLERPLAGKTGTSNESRNTWFSGFSAELVATVWVGFDDNASLGRETGGSAALPVWIDFMRAALNGVAPREFEVPPDVVRVRIDPVTGRPSGAPEAVDEVFVEGTEPQERTEELPSIFIQDDTGPNTTPLGRR